MQASDQKTADRSSFDILDPTKLIRVVVVEAERVGRASTAASTALLMEEPDGTWRPAPAL